MKKSKYRNTSVKTRILIPLFVVCGAMLAMLSYFNSTTARKSMSVYAERHSQMIANSVVYAVDTVNSKGALHRYVSSIGAQPEINSIYVAGGDPLRVIACSEHRLLDEPISEIEDDNLRNLLDRGRNQKEAFFEIRYSEGVAVYLEPIPLGHLAPGNGLGSRGSIMFIFNLKHFREQTANQFFSSTVLGILVLIVTIVIAYVLLVYRVHVPIKKIIDEVSKVESGGAMSVSEDLAKDEIGHLAKILEDSFLKESDSSRQAKFFARNLKFQKDALDVHAIVSEADSRGRITYVNQRFCEISGYSQEELINKDHRILNSGYHSKDFFKELYTSLKCVGSWKGEICNKSKRGDFYWVDSTIVAFVDETGKIERYVSIRADITSRKESEFALMKANEDVAKSLEAENVARLSAEEAAKAKSQFLATMSHEIRTPMNGLIGVLHLLEEGLPSDKRKLLTTARHSADDLLVLINDILDFSKIEAGKMSIETLEFDLLDMVEDICDIHSTTANEKGIELFCNSQARADYWIKGDPHRLRQVVSNLLSNAVKFTEKGNVTISLAIEVNSKDEDVIKIEVQDSGIGIENEQIDTLFESFEQANSSTTRNFGGTGLGLAICKKLVELMGGTIKAHSVVGEGTRFWFELPHVESTEKKTVIGDPDLLKSKQILAVGVDELQKRFYQNWIELWGGGITFVSSLQEFAQNNSAENSSSGNVFDVLIVDQSRGTAGRTELKQTLNGMPSLVGANQVLLRKSGDDSTNDSRSKVIFKPTRVSLLKEALVEQMDHENSSQVSEDDRTSYSSLKVLLVDDNSVNRMIANALLKQRHQIEADNASNGEEALAKVVSGDYDIVFMDCMMPVMDGYEASQAIRDGKAGDRNKDLPIIALTANAMSGDKELCFESGMSDYLSKPIEPKAIASLLAKWQGRSPVEGEATEAEPPREESLKVFDPQNLIDIYDRDIDALNSVLDLFLDELRKTILSLNDSYYGKKDKDQVRFYSHRIKGSSAEFGAMQVKHIAASIEDSIRKESIEQMDSSLFQQLDESFAQLEEVVNSFYSINETRLS